MDIFVNVWMNRWQNEGMTNWMNDQMKKPFTVLLMFEWINEKMGNDWMIEWLNNLQFCWCLNNWMSKWRNDWITEWFNDYRFVHVWINEWQNGEWLND